MPKVKVGDINMYYEIHGEGEPLVMIPGMSDSVESFFWHIPIFSRDYRVVAFDPRGAGRSDAPNIPYTMEMMADDLAGLLDTIGINSAHISGSSMGGCIAQQFALCYPERVTSLILACTGCGGPHSVLSGDAEYISFATDVERQEKLTPEERYRELMPFVVSQEFIDKNPGLIQELIAKMIEYPAPPQGLAGQIQAVMAHDTYERLPEIQAPTLVIHGDADRVVPVENARILASRIPNAELVILEKMGHLFNFEAFDESNRIMLDFLKRHRSSS